MKEFEIIELLERCYTNQKYFVSNAYIFNWESDFFVLTKSDYAWEIEIKTSKSDFRADFKKPKHQLLTAKDLVVEKSLDDHGEGVISSYGIDIDGTILSSNKCGPNCWVKVVDPKTKTPNRFYYCCPEGILSPDDMPEYAGLITINENKVPHYAKQAPMLHTAKNDFTKPLLDKYFWKYRDIKRDLMLTRMQLRKLEQQSIMV